MWREDITRLGIEGSASNTYLTSGLGNRSATSRDPGQAGEMDILSRSIRVNGGAGSSSDLSERGPSSKEVMFGEYPTTVKNILKDIVENERENLVRVLRNAEKQAWSPASPVFSKLMVQSDSLRTLCRAGKHPPMYLCQGFALSTEPGRVKPHA